jgi:O-antigen ligase
VNFFESTTILEMGDVKRHQLRVVWSVGAPGLDHNLGGFLGGLLLGGLFLGSSLLGTGLLGGLGGLFVVVFFSAVGFLAPAFLVVFFLVVLFLTVFFLVAAVFLTTFAFLGFRAFLAAVFGVSESLHLCGREEGVRSAREGQHIIKQRKIKSQ